MTTAWAHELEQLLQETRALLARPEIDTAAWEEYGTRRAAIFARLRGTDCPGEGQDATLVSGLIHEILRHDTLVAEQAQARLTRLRAEIGALVTSRRALRSYAPSQPALLLERCA
ncbi:MAG: flagellar protein FliT [Deltaproteobacteria bacterium]|nr:flagellar protein FliT [Deltaproteobacteria bacterium]